MAAHSPLPWAFDRKFGVIVNRDRGCVTWSDAGPEPSDAEFICRAVNAHESLVAALKAMVKAFTQPAGCNCDGCERQAETACVVALNLADIAIAKVEVTDHAV